MRQARSDRRSTWVAVAACGAILLAFAATAGSAVATKSPTIDEPVHALSGWLALRQGDYHFEVANPALWKMWAALPDVGAAPRLDRTGPLWRAVAWAPSAETAWAQAQLFGTAGNDGVAFVGRARAMMLVVGVGLGAAVAGWAGRLGGPVAAVVAVAVFACDPTLLGHAPLVKSDVAESLALLGLGWATWRFGQRATVARAVGLGLVCGAAVNVKLSGLMAGPVLAGLLLIRASGPSPWPVGRRVAATRPARLSVAVAAAALAAVTCLTVTWGVYRFRYRPTPSGAVSIDLPAVYAVVAETRAGVALGRRPTPAETAALGQGPLLRVGRWAGDHRLLPQAFVAGLLYQSACSARWPAYLDGEAYTDGRWRYFPLAAAYKTPLAELAAWAAALGVGVVAVLARAWRRRPDLAWGAACVGLPAVAFGAAAVAVAVNVGLRSVLPLYADADVAVGCAAAWAWRRRPAATAAVASALLAAQAVTAAAAWPDYIAFFNAAAGGARGGVRHLSDSNLDWGQDVPALAAWQRAHPDVPLYTDLFAIATPAVYGVRDVPLWAVDRTSQQVRLNRPDRPAVLAVSVTYLQGMYVPPAKAAFFARLAARPPRQVLHGTIALFDYHPGPDSD